MRWPAVALALLAVAGAPPVGADSGAVAVDYLASYDLPAGLLYEGSCVGGLSALEYDPAADRYWAIADDSEEARYYRLRIDVEDPDGDGEARIGAVSLEQVVRLRSREGRVYGAGEVDPEGFVLAAGDLAGDGPGAGATAWVSSEGVAENGVPPFVDRVEVATGAYLQSLTIPVDLHPEHDGDRQTRGVRQNLGFESLTLSEDRRHLWVATESAPAQDLDGAGGEEPRAGDRLYARLLHFGLEPSPRLLGRYLYPLTHPEGKRPIHGLVELLAIGGGGEGGEGERFLALERTYSNVVGLAVKLFELRLGDFLDDAPGEDGPDDARYRLAPEDRGLPVLAKRHLLDLGELPPAVDNFEGLTFGPRLPDGSESLLVLGDNDNTACAPTVDPTRLRPTRLLLFRIRR